jgi:hypothetical protein
VKEGFECVDTLCISGRRFMATLLIFNSMSILLSFFDINLARQGKSNEDDTVSLVS